MKGSTRCTKTPTMHRVWERTHRKDVLYSAHSLLKPLHPNVLILNSKWTFIIIVKPLLTMRLGES